MIVTLCGSARFEPWFHAWNEALSLSGHCVFGLSSYPSFHEGEREWYDKAEKTVLDVVHADKIRISDAILVLNVFSYIGESTLREIRVARVIQSTQPAFRIFSLESWGEGCGVCSMHTHPYREAAARYGCDDARSPISTVWGDMSCPFDLLPEGGRYRSKLIRRLNILDRKARGYALGAELENT